MELINKNRIFKIKMFKEKLSMKRLNFERKIQEMFADEITIFNNDGG